MTEAMPRKRLPHLRHEQNRHGTWCWYFRKGNGPRVRLWEPFGSPAFMAEYDAALAGTPAKKSIDIKSGTVAWLVERYKASGHFQSLAESSQYFRANLLQKMVGPIGHVQFARIERKHIQRAMDDRAKTPFAANNLLVAVSQLFEFAIASGYLSDNPCANVKPFKVSSEGHHTWSVAEVERYRAHHPVGTRARLALDLLLFTGLRRSDIIVIGRQHVREGVLEFRTKKTKSVIFIPIFPELRDSIAATKTGDLAFITAERGRPFSSPVAFGVRFRIWCGEAGLPKECTAHGVRKAGATIAANRGASASELMAMYGWSRISMAERYTRAADKARLARSAAERIANVFSPHPQSGAAETTLHPAENKGVKS